MKKNPLQMLKTSHEFHREPYSVRTGFFCRLGLKNSVNLRFSP